MSPGYRRLWAAFVPAAIVGLSVDNTHPFLMTLAVFVPLWAALGAIHWFHMKRRPWWRRSPYEGASQWRDRQTTP